MNNYLKSKICFTFYCLSLLLFQLSIVLSAPKQTPIDSKNQKKLHIKASGKIYGEVKTIDEKQFMKMIEN